MLRPYPYAFQIDSLRNAFQGLDAPAEVEQELVQVLVAAFAVGAGFAV